MCVQAIGNKRSNVQSRYQFIADCIELNFYHSFIQHFMYFRYNMRTHEISNKKFVKIFY